MSEKPVPEPLREFLSTYCDVNAMDMVTVLRDQLTDNEIPPDQGNLFRRQLAEAILHHILSPKQYKEITGDNEYNTPEELEAWLRELWHAAVCDEPFS